MTEFYFSDELLGGPNQCEKKDDPFCYISKFYSQHTVRRHYNLRLVYFYPFFSAVYIIEWLVLQTIYLLKKEILQFFGLKSEVSNQERVIMACLWYLELKKIS